LTPAETNIGFVEPEADVKGNPVTFIFPVPVWALQAKSAEINTQFFEDHNIDDNIKDYLRQLYTPKNIDKRNEELHNKYVASILNGDPLPRCCNDFIGGVIVEAIKSIKLDEIKDISEIKKSDYYKLIELNKNIENSDEIIKAIIKYPKEFEKLVEASSKLKATNLPLRLNFIINKLTSPVSAESINWVNQFCVALPCTCLGLLARKKPSPAVLF
jgi:hypothetical protein